MDYWSHLDVTIYDNWGQFMEKNSDVTLYFFSTKTERSFWDCAFEPGAFLVFGNEGSGLPPDFYQNYREQLYTIPMFGEFNRSLNLANSVSIVLYEGLRKLNCGVIS
jgi:tRNA (cytidine/uridine-2'-O-)-methyltransferase